MTLTNSISQVWKPLRPGDIVDIIAPAAACPSAENPFQAVRETLSSWGLVPRLPDDIYGEDLLCANTDAKRFTFLKNALLNTESTAIWCLRGGYGCARLMSQISTLPQPLRCKLFIGMSDITALHIFFQQQWHWATLHAPSARQISLKPSAQQTNLGEVAEENIAEIKKIIFGEQTICQFNNLTSLNLLAKQNKTITAPIIGGNLCLVQTSIGTPWQINAAGKILFLEEINERGYRVDRMLQHLEQAGVFKEVVAVIFGDFIGGTEPNGHSLIEPVLRRFAEQCDFPVLRCPGIGHGKFNRPLPLGIPTQLYLGENCSFTVAL